ncbi:large subunit ribosomal protein L24e [Vigna unguiculata]|uniref:Large ribosomal subunit protein eL24 n=1 Tax=Vigna unguiculata TaxID=3917 RepID=A0A4D6N0B7_VIGUN|nr:large subunit ribosomal protein L24e [Vigna unguiculata]
MKMKIDKVKQFLSQEKEYKGFYGKGDSRGGTAATMVLNGAKIYPGKGIRFVRGDSQVFLFANSKCKRYFHNRLKPSKLTWTAMYRKQHKKDIAQEAVKKRRRATKKPYSRSIVGATLEVIQKKRTEKPEVRDAAREAALREIKERVKKTKDEKKAKKAEVQAKLQKSQGKGAVSKGAAPKGPKLGGLHQPQQDSVYYVHNPYTQASSSTANDDHEPDEEHERQSSLVEEPRLEVHRRNPTRNRRRPRTQIQDLLHFHSSYTPPSRFVFSASSNPCRSGYFLTKATARRPYLSPFASPLGVAIKRRSSGLPLPFSVSKRTIRLRSQGRSYPSGRGLGLGSLVGGRAPLTSVGLGGAPSTQGSALGPRVFGGRVPLTTLGK